MEDKRCAGWRSDGPGPAAAARSSDYASTFLPPPHHHQHKLKPQAPALGNGFLSLRVLCEGRRDLLWTLQANQATDESALGRVEPTPVYLCPSCATGLNPLPLSWMPTPKSISPTSPCSRKRETAGSSCTRSPSMVMGSRSQASTLSERKPAATRSVSSLLSPIAFS
ncbi:hypothetical protein FA95DRAFT_405831 [Auriscalpium vulgare]|uniref:Uncharacterized protein n=1 Tax=Auriscalpium vulgare TaxID=40419 RepID=A0ACB8RIN6_9AGAM|nr:hypothetical protein FA95DRAFT_405831 [Auriscalpium vulgare]